MSSQARELDKLTYEEITRLCKNGDELANQHKYDDAVSYTHLTLPTNREV